MNFLKKMLGFQTEQNQGSKNDERESFESECSLFQIEQKVKTLIFPICTVKFLSNPTKLFDYSLYFKEISNQYQPKEYYFPIHEDMNLHSSYRKNEKEGEIISYIWALDPENTLSVEFRNINNGLAKAMVFKEIMCKMIFETTWKKSAELAKNEEEYLSLCREIEVNKNSRQRQEESLEVKAKIEKKVSNENFDMSKLLPEYSTKKGVLLCNVVSFYKFDKKENEILISNSVILVIQDMGNFAYFLELYNQDREKIYSKEINSELNYDLNSKDNCLKWVDLADNILRLLMLRFLTYNFSINLQFLLNKCLFENNRKEKLEKAMDKDEMDIANKLLAQDKMDIEFEVQAPFQQYPDLELGEFCSSYKGKDNNKNKTFAQATMLDRTFLSRGDIVEVFKTEEENQNNLEYIVSLPPLKSLSKQPIHAKKLLLQEEDSKILILDEKDNKSVFYMDLEKGKIVSELTIDGVNSVMDICPESKHSNLTTNPVFLGINQKNLFKLDPRLPSSSCLVSKKIYATNPKFTTITPTLSGAFAAANAIGEVRLYKEMGQNALNLYPGLGDPIKSLDCTKDGRFLLATCKNYLMFMATFNGPKNGFASRIKNSEKPAPKLLRIHPSDIVLIKEGDTDCEFSNGHFDDSLKKMETYIVVGFGKAIVTWNLKHILDGKIYEYSIKKLEGKIVESEFKFDCSDRMLIALEGEMRMQRTSIKGKKEKKF